MKPFADAVCHVASGPQNEQLTCIAGYPLDSQEEARRAQLWNAIQGVRKAGGWAGDAITVGGACTMAQDFATNCRAWDAHVDAVRFDVCAIAAADCAPEIAPRRRPGAAQDLRADITARMARSVDVTQLKDPNEAASTVTYVNDSYKSLACYDVGTDQVDEDRLLGARVVRWSTDINSSITTEVACRASSECLAARKKAAEEDARLARIEGLASQICDGLRDARATRTDIARERSNPTGVVDLSTLHDLGEKLQYEQSDVQSARAEYRAAAKKSFNEGSCPK